MRRTLRAGISLRRRHILTDDAQHRRCSCVGAQQPERAARRIGLLNARAVGRKRAAQQRERMESAGRGISVKPGVAAAGVAARKPGPTSSQSAGFRKDYDDKGRSKTVQRYASMSVTKLTLGEMMRYGEEMTEGKLIKSARHLHYELPVRLAQRIVDFQAQPYAIISNPHFKQVYHKYHDAFDRFRTFPSIKDMEDEQAFTKLVETLVAEHITVIPILGQGMSALRGTHEVGAGFMDRLLMTRISRRVLAEQHIALHKAQLSKAGRRPGYIGVIHTQCKLQDVVRRCFDKAAQICERTYGHHPPLQFCGDPDATLAYIPVHLEYMILELLKNAMRCTVEFTEQNSPPAASQLGNDRHFTDLMRAVPIVATLASTDDYTTLRISDCGGGIPVHIEERVFDYGYTSVGASDGGIHRPGRGDESRGLGTLGAGGLFPSAPLTEPDPIAGLGFGLPLAQCYARYFGGSIKLVSLPGHGTDAYLRLNTTGLVVEQVALL
jgi:[3-methyl-2-oxobutanoate dehydrogenase (acetyl-transferring)] kinase